jgi:transposase InsO family protein
MNERRTYGDAVAHSHRLDGSPALITRSLPRSQIGITNEARQIIEEWRIDYNTNRPHTSLNGLTPTEFATRPNWGQNQNRLSL